MITNSLMVKGEKYVKEDLAFQMIKSMLVNVGFKVEEEVLIHYAFSMAEKIIQKTKEKP